MLWSARERSVGSALTVQVRVSEVLARGREGGTSQQYTKFSQSANRGCPATLPGRVP